MTIFSKHVHLSNHLANQSKVICGTSMRRGCKHYLKGIGHMTRVATMPIYGKHLKTFFSEPEDSLIVLKFGMKQQVFKVYIKDDPGLTLTYSMER